MKLIHERAKKIHKKGDQYSITIKEATKQLKKENKL